MPSLTMSAAATGERRATGVHAPSASTPRPTNFTAGCVARPVAFSDEVVARVVAADSDISAKRTRSGSHRDVLAKLLAAGASPPVSSTVRFKHKHQEVPADIDSSARRTRTGSNCNVLTGVSADVALELAESPAVGGGRSEHSEIDIPIAFLRCRLAPPVPPRVLLKAVDSGVDALRRSNHRRSGGPENA